MPKQNDVIFCSVMQYMCSCVPPYLVPDQIRHTAASCTYFKWNCHFNSPLSLFCLHVFTRHCNNTSSRLGWANNKTHVSDTVYGGSMEDAQFSFLPTDCCHTKTLSPSSNEIMTTPFPMISASSDEEATAASNR